MSMQVFNILTEDQFAERFPLVRNHLDADAAWDGCLFETHGAEFDFVRAQPHGFVWTVVDVDGTLVVTSGLWVVNRIGYLVSTVPVPADRVYDVIVRDEEVQP